MAKATVKLVKKSARGMKSPARMKVGDPGATDFILIDNEDNTLTVIGTNAAQNDVDISDVATITVTSSDPSVLTVDPPAGMTAAFHGIKAGTVTLSITATWNDGTVGPFSFDLPGEVKTGGATGIHVHLGKPVPR